jgi:hypothetical protein
MTYQKITTELTTSESINFDDNPDVQMLTTYNTADVTLDGSSRLVDSLTILAPLSGDGPDPLLAGLRVRTVTVEVTPDSPTAAVITFNSVSICSVPIGASMFFVALSAQSDQDKYGIYSNSTTDQAIVRIITTSFATL